MRKLVTGAAMAVCLFAWFTGIEPFGGANVSASIAVELSEDACVREAILRKEAGFWQTPEASPDVGQRFIIVGFD